MQSGERQFTFSHLASLTECSQWHLMSFCATAFPRGIGLALANHVPAGNGPMVMSTGLSFFSNYSRKNKKKCHECVLAAFGRQPSVLWAPGFPASKQASIARASFHAQWPDGNLEADVVPTCAALGITVVAYSPLCRNLLTGTVTGPPVGDRRAALPRCVPAG